MTESKRTEYNTVLGKTETGGIYVLSDTFRYSDGFHGATGAVLEPVTQEQIDTALKQADKTEWYEELWRQDAGATNGTELSLKDWVAQIPDDDYIESRFEEFNDLSTEEIAAALGDEPPARYQLVGIGRIFSADTFAQMTLIDSDEVRAAIAAIREAEEGNP